MSYEFLNLTKDLFFLGGFAFAMICAVHIVKYIYDYCDKKSIIKYAAISGVCMLAFVCTTVLCIDNLQNKLDRGYVVYLDGQQVDPDNINLSSYFLNIDDDKKIIKATKKEEHQFIPVIFPR